MRLTASDRPGMAQPVPERDVPERPWPAILLGAALLFAMLLGGWEVYWRDYGVTPGYRDDAALWARERRRLTADGNAPRDATVLVGSSRNFFDVSLPVWERVGGRRPIQLSIVGTSPVFALEDLAQESTFRGQVLVDIAPDIFFTGFAYRAEFGKYWRKESPSERVGKWLSMTFVEPWFAFYDGDFALSTVLRRQAWAPRPGLPGGMPVRKLEIVGPDRAAYMWSKLETDPEYRALARRIWAHDFHAPPPTPAERAEAKKTLDEQIERTRVAVKALRARGAVVVFVRHPTGGDYLEFEQREFPRRDTWDLLLARTGAPGVHFEDHATLRQGYDFPEWSHMSRSSAERYTAELYRVLEEKHPLPDGRRW
jgi:hypothetical protein